MKKQTKNHLGRTMIEMLGVLAIIGVLSIGGLWGYNQAMLRYRLGQTQRWFDTVRFIIAEACVNGNAQACTIKPSGGQESYKNRADYVCSQTDKSICPKEGNNMYGNARTPLNESVTLLHMNSASRIIIFLKGLDERTCKAVIDYDWHALKYISKDKQPVVTESVQAPLKHLTNDQKENLKALCPFPQYLILGFDLES